MDAREKFDRILGLLPEDGSLLKVDNAPLCPDNDWIEHTIRDLWREESSCEGFRIRYHTISGIPGSIYRRSSGEYADDLHTLYAWIVEHGYFGRIDRNLFN